eukprot:evm.model.scf_1509.4 EVM.evm.TU.scf_1509.4   scf_1509:19855-26098(-)
MLDCLRDRDCGLFEGRPNKFRRAVCGNESLVRRMELLRRLEGGHEGCVNTCRFTHDGSTLLSGGDDLHVVLWDWELGKERLRYHSGHCDNVFCARQLPQHRTNTIITTGADGQVRCGTLGEGGQVETFHMAAHANGCNHFTLDPDCADVCYSCGEDGYVLMFDLRVPRYLNQKAILCHDRSVAADTVSLTTNDINPHRTKEMVVGGSDEYARVYDMRKFSTCSFQGSANEDAHHTVCEPLYFVSPQHLRGRRGYGIAAHITCATYSMVGELLVTYSDENIYLFNCSQRHAEYVADDEMREGKEPPAVQEHVQTCSHNKGSSDDPREVAQYLQMYDGHRNRRTVKKVMFLGSSEEYVVSGSDCGHIFMWSKTSGRLERVVKGDSYIVNCLVSHPSMHLLMATSGIDNNVKLWAPTANEPHVLGEDVDEIVQKNKDKSYETRMPWATYTLEMLLLQLARRAEARRGHNNGWGNGGANGRGRRRSSGRQGTDSEQAHGHAQYMDVDGGSGEEIANEGDSRVTSAVGPSTDTWSDSESSSEMGSDQEGPEHGAGGTSALQSERSQQS